MNYFTKDALFSAVGDSTTLIELNSDESSIIITEYGGRPLGIFPKKGCYSLLWINQKIKEMITTRNRSIGGDRYWISPEREYFYKDGLVISNTLYTKNDIKQNESRYEYDVQGNKIKWSLYDGSGVLLAYTTYEYSNGRNTKIEIYSPSDLLEKYSEIEYGTHSLRIRESFYKPDKKLEKYILYEYEDGALKSEKHLTESENLIRRVNYDHDRMGNTIEIRYFDSRDNLKEVIRREYIYRKIKRKVDKY